MDLLPTLQSLPQLGGAAVLAWIVVLLLRREGRELARERTAHAETIARLRAHHAEDLTDRDEEIERLQLRLQSADLEIDRLRGLAATTDLPRLPPGRHRYDGSGRS